MTTDYKALAPVTQCLAEFRQTLDTTPIDSVKDAIWAVAKKHDHIGAMLAAGYLSGLVDFNERIARDAEAIARIKEINRKINSEVMSLTAVQELVAERDELRDSLFHKKAVSA